jgi:hypothetical protein
VHRCRPVARSISDQGASAPASRWELSRSPTDTSSRRRCCLTYPPGLDERHPAAEPSGRPPESRCPPSPTRLCASAWRDPQNAHLPLIRRPERTNCVRSLLNFTRRLHESFLGRMRSQRWVRVVSGGSRRRPEAARSAPSGRLPKVTYRGKVSVKGKGR